jgi:hypothetical protein
MPPRGVGKAPPELGSPCRRQGPPAPAPDRGTGPRGLDRGPPRPLNGAGHERRAGRRGTRWSVPGNAIYRLIRHWPPSSLNFCVMVELLLPFASLDFFWTVSVASWPSMTSRPPALISAEY